MFRFRCWPSGSRGIGVVSPEGNMEEELCTNDEMMMRSFAPKFFLDQLLRLRRRDVRQGYALPSILAIQFGHALGPGFALTIQGLRPAPGA